MKQMTVYRLKLIQQAKRLRCYASYCATLKVNRRYRYFQARKAYFEFLAAHDLSPLDVDPVNINGDLKCRKENSFNLQ